MKTKTQIKDPVSRVLETFVGQIRMDVFEACAKKAHPENVTMKELFYAKTTIEHVWNAFSSSLNECQREHFSLLQKKKWPDAIIFFQDFKIKLKSFEQDCFHGGLIQNYVAASLKSGRYKELEYTHWSNSIALGDEIGEYEIDPALLNFNSIVAFELEMGQLLKLAEAVSDKMKKDTHEAKTGKRFEKFADRTPTISSIFRRSEELVFALQKLVEGDFAVIRNGKFEYTYNKSGRIYLLAEWLLKCNNKGFLNNKYDYTTCAKIVLSYFGFSLDKADAARSFLSTDENRIKYQNMLGT